MRLQRKELAVSSLLYHAFFRQNNVRFDSLYSFYRVSIDLADILDSLEYNNGFPKNRNPVQRA